MPRLSVRLLRSKLLRLLLLRLLLLRLLQSLRCQLPLQLLNLLLHLVQVFFLRVSCPLNLACCCLGNQAVLQQLQASSCF